VEGQNTTFDRTLFSHIFAKRSSKRICKKSQYLMIKSPENLPKNLPMFIVEISFFFFFSAAKVKFEK
jgi:hypothetical protein